MRASGPPSHGASPGANRLSDLITVRQLSGAFLALRSFLSDSQYKALALEILQPESAPLCAFLMAVSQIVSAIARIGEQAERGAEAFVYLHYRKGTTHWLVLECGDPGPAQSVDLVCYVVHAGEQGSTERHSMTSKALRSLGAELDLSFYPCAFREIDTSGVSLRPQVSAPRDRSESYDHGRCVA